ncbi:unnamed protein product [Discosporangium mesarthrocarpum]
MACLENIYNLVPQEPEISVKPAIYRSRHKHEPVLAGSTFGTHGTTQPLGAAHMKKQEHGTMGRLAEVHRKDPSQYLKKSSEAGAALNGKGATEVKPSTFKYPANRKERVPKRGDCPVTGIVSKKNFITSNAVETILAVPSCKDKVEVDYLAKEDYGKVPKYLSQPDTSERLGEMKSAEREDLVDALKMKWDSVNQKYQLMAHMVNLDTFGKLRRKEQMEKELRGLEDDINKLEKGPVLVRP